jgi:hypothetical protein
VNLQALLHRDAPSEVPGPQPGKGMMAAVMNNVDAAQEKQAHGRGSSDPGQA